MSAVLKPSEVLAKAADLIEPRGAWTQGKFGDDNGKCWCAIGACIQAGGGWDAQARRRRSVWAWEPVLFIARALKLGSNENVADWNDASSRRKGQVVAALRKASELAKAEGQ